MYVTGWRDAFHTAMLFITAATCEKQQHKPKMGICIPDKPYSIWPPSARDRRPQFY
jgi:hypothetical protein